MKARIPLNNRQLKMCRDVVNDLTEKRQVAFTRRIYKLYAFVLNREFQFGRQRIERIIAKINQLLIESDSDELFWDNIDRVVIDELKIQFEREITDLDGNLTE